MWVIALCFVCSGTYPANAQTTPSPKTPPLPPLLPAEQAWLVTLAARPSAGGAMDDARVYIPTGSRDVSVSPDAPSGVVAQAEDSATQVKSPDGGVAQAVADAAAPAATLPGGPGRAAIVALDRETGQPRWTRPLESPWPPAVAGPLLIVVTRDAVHALDAATGDHRWRTALPRPALAAPQISAGQVLVAIEPDVLLALRLSDGSTAWEQSLGHERGPVAMLVDGEAVYLTLPGSRVVRVSGIDGRLLWTRTLAGVLAKPGVARDRVLGGSDDNVLYALDAQSGAVRWTYRTGGDVVGVAALDDTIFAASLDNVLRALNRGNGNQKWKRALTTRPPSPPEAFRGLVVVYGLSPTIAAFSGRDGTTSGV